MASPPQPISLQARLQAMSSLPKAPMNPIKRGFIGAWGGKKHQCPFISNIFAVFLPTPSSHPGCELVT